MWPVARAVGRWGWGSLVGDDRRVTGVSQGQGGGRVRNTRGRDARTRLGAASHPVSCPAVRLPLSRSNTSPGGDTGFRPGWGETLPGVSEGASKALSDLIVGSSVGRPGLRGSPSHRFWVCVRLLWVETVGALGWGALWTRHHVGSREGARDTR